MDNVVEEAIKHLRELGGFDVPNPVVAKAITMRRLMESGVDEDKAHRAVINAFARHNDFTMKALEENKHARSGVQAQGSGGVSEP